MKLISAEAFLKHTQTPGTRHEIDEIIAPVLFVQNIFGHQILNPKWTWRDNAFKLTCVVLLLTYVILGTIDVMQTTDDFHLYSEAIFTLIITYQFTFQAIFFVIFRATFREVYVMAKQSIFSTMEEISSERCGKLISLFKNMIKAVYFFTVTPALQYLCTALWYYFKGIRVTLSPSTSILMPMSSPTYEVGLILHLVFLILVGGGAIILNMWFFFLSIFFCEACDCAITVLKVKKENDNSYAKTLNEALAKFYSVHMELMKYLNTLNMMYKWPLLVPMFAGLMLTCVFLLVTTEEVNWRLAIVVFVEFVAVSAYNMLGERIKTKTEEMNMALLHFDWLSMRIKDRKNYCIIISYMNREFGIYTALGADLSLLTLSSIYKGSYQAYAVFNTVNN